MEENVTKQAIVIEQAFFLKDMGSWH